MVPHSGAPPVVAGAPRSVEARSPAGTYGARQAPDWPGLGDARWLECSQLPGRLGWGAGDHAAVSRGSGWRRGVMLGRRLGDGRNSARVAQADLASGRRDQSHRDAALDAVQRAGASELAGGSLACDRIEQGDLTYRSGSIRAAASRLALTLGLGLH